MILKQEDFQTTYEKDVERWKMPLCKLGNILRPVSDRAYTGMGGGEGEKSTKEREREGGSVEAEVEGS